MPRKKNPPQHWTELPGDFIHTKDDWDLFLDTASEEELERASREVYRQLKELCEQNGVPVPVPPWENRR